MLHHMPIKLRKSFISKRALLTESYQKKSALNLKKIFVKQKLFSKYNNFAVYDAFKGELNLQLLINYLWQENKNCYLPNIDNKDKRMQFYLYKRYMNLVKNSYGIKQTIPSYNTIIKAEAIEVALIPGVAFDINGNRLGMGLGYYDRYFSYRLQNKKTPILCGIAYSWQIVKKITHNSWDVKMDLIITDKSLIWTKN